MEQLLKKIEDHQKLICLVIFVMTVICMGRVAYWYHQWQSWRDVNQMVLQQVSHISRTGDHTEVLQQWKEARQDVMTIIQEEGMRQGVTVLSLTGTHGAKDCEIECSGTFAGLLSFFNELERYAPPVHIELVQMNSEEDIVTATVRVENTQSL